MSSGIRIPFHSEFAEQGNLYLLVAFSFLVIFYMRHMMVLHFGMIHISINWLLHDEQWNMNIFLQHLMSRGCKQHIQSCTNEDTEWCWWYHDWSSWRTCILLKLTWWSCWNIGHEGWFFLFSSCLLYNHAEWNIFFHDFGTWCLSSGTSVCVFLLGAVCARSGTITTTQTFWEKNKWEIIGGRKGLKDSTGFPWDFLKCWWQLKHFWIFFTPKIWGNDHIWQAYFSGRLKETTN